MKLRRQQPLRTCVGCRNRRPGPELVRFSANADAVLTIDYGKRLEGRGAYLCPSRACLETAVTRKAFSRALRREVALPGIQILWSQVQHLAEK